MANTAVKPEEFQCVSLDYRLFKEMEELVKSLALISRNQNWTRVATLVTDDVSLLAKDKSAYVAAGLKSKGLQGVCWSARNIPGYQLWINPTLTAFPTVQEQTVLHELCHAMVATGTSHDESFRKLYHRSLFHWSALQDRKWDSWDLAWKCVERYTVRRVDNYLEYRYGYESLEAYHDRIDDECMRAVRMIQKEHVEVMKVLHDGFGWNV
jgi:hypothetical protein